MVELQSVVVTCVDVEKSGTCVMSFVARNKRSSADTTPKVRINKGRQIPPMHAMDGEDYRKYATVMPVRLTQCGLLQCQ